MSGEVNYKLLEIVQYCSENKIRISFTQHGGKKNLIEETVEMGERVIQIQLGDKDDVNLFSLLSEFLNNIKV
jgi:hypothetical protein